MTSPSIPGREAVERLLLGWLGGRMVRADTPPRLPATVWTRLVEEALRLGVAPLLHAALACEPEADPPEAEAARLRDVYLHNRLRNQAILGQLREIGVAAAAAGIELVPLKGAHLFRVAYPDPGLRPMADIDLLARPGDLPAARRALETEGYASRAPARDYSGHHHLEPLARRGAVDVELHHDLAAADAPFRVDLPSLWERSTPETDLPGLRRLAPDDLLLHTSVHAAFNDRFRVGLLACCDIDATIRHYGGEIDWAGLVRTANADGRARFAYASLRLASRLLHPPVPPTVWSDLDHGAGDDAVVAHAAARAFDPHGDAPVTVRRLADAKGAVPRLAILARGLFPPPGELRRIYRLPPGSRLAALWYLWRPLDLAIRRGRDLVGLLLGGSDPRSARARERRRRVIRAWIRGP